MPSNQETTTSTKARRPQEHRPEPHRPGPSRLGPQPLPLHLGLALTSWSNSAAILPGLMLAWQHLKSQRSPIPTSEGSADQNQHQQGQTNAMGPAPALPESLQTALQMLGPQLDAADPAALAKALSDEGHHRLDDFVSGALAYRRQPPAPARPSRPVLWSEGSTRLLDYRSSLKRHDQSTAPRILVIPSLINRYYILDLAPQASFLDFLAEAGCQPFVVDWDEPDDEERGFTLTDYIAGRLRKAYRALQQESGGPIIVIGYCMGGLLALALTQLLLQSKALPPPAGLVLLATPWDFHAEQASQSAMIAAIGHQLEPIMAALGELPVDLLQSFFALLDPFQVPKKFQAFAKLSNVQPPASDAVLRFTQLEDWLNDGVGLAAAVARECLRGWYGENSTKNGSWRVGGHIIDPNKITIPSLVLIPSRDRIVPPGSALGLAQALPFHDIETPPLGHIGMMAGSKAKTGVWPRIAHWIKRQARSYQAV